MENVIRIFEHENLFISERFQRHHWTALAKYNERNGSMYFTLLPDGVRFNQFVGVVQAGNLTIEILPKIQKLDENEQEDKRKWRTILLHMLHECRFIRVAHPEKAALQLYSGSILEAYLQRYLEEIERLLHEGLSKHYRKVEGNRSAFKGSLRFSHHIRQNLVHAERFYVRHSVYDREHQLHNILYKALQIVNNISTGHAVRSLAGRLLLDFPEMPEIRVTEDTFRRLKLSRKEDRYREALLIAKMLLLQFRPDIQSGEEHVLALLFDMNRLWEEYVYRQLVRLECAEFRVSAQESRGFWHLHSNEKSPRTVRPDLVIEVTLNEGKAQRIIVDTKWKLIEDNEPSDDDLKQMFSYAHYFDSSSLMLLYPSVEKEHPAGRFAREHIFQNQSEVVTCSILKVPIKESQEEICLDIAIADFS